MVNHPNRSKRMIWTQDGDQWLFAGTLGTYRIAERTVQDSSNFVIRFKSKGGGSKDIGEFSTLSNAKAAAEQYDGYRSYRQDAE